MCVVVCRLVCVLLFVGWCVCCLCIPICVFVDRLQKIVTEALERPAAEVTLTASFFAELFTRVTVVSYDYSVSTLQAHIAVACSMLTTCSMWESISMAMYPFSRSYHHHTSGLKLQ